MITLTQTTDKIQVKLSGTVTANQLQCYASYRDTTTSSITPGRSVVLTNNTTAVDLVGSSASSTQRLIERISIYNSDTAAATVTILFNDNGTTYELAVVPLAFGEILEYQEGAGFKTSDRFGSLKKQAYYPSLDFNSSFSTTILANDVVNNNAVANTIADITGLSFSVTSGKTYYFSFTIAYTSVATTTGARFSINGPAATYLNYWTRFPNATNSVNTYLGLTSYDLPAAASTTSPAASATIGGVANIEGFVTPSASGTLIGRFASEVANSAITAKKGSVVYYKQLD